MTYSSISIPEHSVLAPFDTFDKLLSFCLFYENGEEWARHVLDKDVEKMAESCRISDVYDKNSKNKLMDVGAQGPL